MVPQRTGRGNFLRVGGPARSGSSDDVSFVLVLVLDLLRQTEHEDEDEDEDEAKVTRTPRQ
jgi:hypothetical protein